MHKSNKVSAGLLMYSASDKELRIFLAHPGGPYFTNKDNGHWGIPKGETEAGEDLLEAAIREFNEETGLNPNGPYIAMGCVQLKSGKTVHAWAFSGDWSAQQVLVSNTFTLEWPPKSGCMQEFPEIDCVGFFTLQEALLKINTAQIPFLERLLDHIKQS